MANIKKTKKYHLVKALWKTVSQYLLTLCAIAQNWQLLRCLSAEESGVAYSLAEERRTAKTRTLTTSHNTDVSKQCPVNEANIREKNCGNPCVPSTNQPTVSGLWLSSGCAVTARGYRVGGLPRGWCCSCFLSWVLEIW